MRGERSPRADPRRRARPAAPSHGSRAGANPIPTPRRTAGSKHEVPPFLDRFEPGLVQIDVEVECFGVLAREGERVRRGVDRRHSRTGMLAAIASAIAPDPVPRSSTRGAGSPARSARQRSTTISVSGLGTSARASVFRSDAGSPFAEDVGERLPPRAPLDQLVQAVRHSRSRSTWSCDRVTPRRARRAAPSPRAACRRRPCRGAPPRVEALLRPSLAERALALFGAERFGEVVQLALQDAIELMHRELDAVIGDAVLGIVVRPDLLSRFAGPDLRAPGRVELCPLLLALESNRRARKTRSAFCRFCSWLFSSCIATTSPVGRCVIARRSQWCSRSDRRARSNGRRRS